MCAYQRKVAEKLKEDITALKVGIAEAEKRTTEATSQLPKARERFNRSREEAEKLKKRINNIKTEIAEIDRRIDEKPDMLEYVYKQIDENFVICEKLAREEMKKSAKLTELEESLKDVQNRVASMEQFYSPDFGLSKQRMLEQKLDKTCKRTEEASMRVKKLKYLLAEQERKREEQDVEKNLKQIENDRGVEIQKILREKIVLQQLRAEEAEKKVEFLQAKKKKLRERLAKEQDKIDDVNRELYPMDGFI